MLLERGRCCTEPLGSGARRTDWGTFGRQRRFFRGLCFVQDTCWRCVHSCWDSSNITSASSRPRKLFGSSSSMVLADLVTVRHALITRLVAACRRVGQFRPRLLLWSTASSQEATRILEVVDQECVLGLFRLGLTRASRYCERWYRACLDGTRRRYRRYHSP